MNNIEVLSDDKDLERLETEVEGFIRRHALSDTRFGILATNDEHLIPNMRGGRRFHRATRRRIRKFMHKWEIDFSVGDRE